jgi:N-acetylneuraminate lyase
MTDRFRGVWPALLTPLAADGRPALDVLTRLIERLVAEGLDGLYVTGSTGQWPLLAFDERTAIVERAVAAAGGRVPVIVHVGANATDEAAALARHAARAGADAVSAVAPTYYAHSAEAATEHYRRIGAATDLPLYVYHLGGVSGAIARPAEYVERLLALPHIAGMKYTERDLYTLGVIHALAGERLRLFSGADELLCHAALSGAVGAIGSFYNVWGGACRRARAAFAAGDVEAGRRFMLTFQRVLARVMEPGGVWSFLRGAVRVKHGVDVGRPRAPLGVAEREWREGEVERLVAEVDEAAPS